MKLKWVAEDRELPGVGILKRDALFKVDDRTGEQLIRQKLAVEVMQESRKKPKGGDK